MASNIKKIENMTQNNFVKIVKGSIISVLISIILLVTFALLLAYTNVPESIIMPVIIVICALSILVRKFYK